jgi:hypothetical protein
MSKPRPFPVNEINATLKRLRLIQAGLIFFLLVSASLAELTPRRGTAQWSFGHYLMAGIALFCLLEGFNFHYRFLPTAASWLARDVTNPRALRRWQAWQLTCLVLPASVTFDGITFRMAFNGRLWQAALFYAVGLFFLLLWTPRLPAGAPFKR